MGKARGPKELPKLGLNPRALTPADGRTLSLRIRVTPQEAADLKEAASILGVPVGAYIRELHRQAFASLKGQKGR